MPESEAPCPSCGDRSPRVPLLAGHDRLLGAPGAFSVSSCPGCGLALTVPRISADQFDLYYPETYPNYLVEPDRKTARQRLGAHLDDGRFTLSVKTAFGPLTRRTPGRLLDVGCGRGELGAWFAARGWEVAGIEPSENAARQAAARGLNVHVGTLDDAPFEEESFDAAIFNHALEHIPEPDQALARTRNLLRPGGLVVVSVPNFACWQRRAFRSRWFPLDLPRHLQHFDRRTLARTMRRGGLEPMGVRTSSMMVGLPGSLEYAALGRKRLPAGWFLRLAYLVYPIVAVTDLVSEGDCLHLTARRPA